MDDDLDFAAVAGEMLVDRVVEHLENAVVQTAFIGVADIHAGPFPDRFETLQFVDLRGVVFLVFADAGGVRLTLLVLFLFVFWSDQNGGWHELAKR